MRPEEPLAAGIFGLQRVYLSLQSCRLRWERVLGHWIANYHTHNFTNKVLEVGWRWLRILFVAAALTLLDDYT